MQKERLMTIGEVAKKMKVTVRTIQYYDKEGLLKPSGYSEGGRRLYNNKDIIQLHQILSMKYLGFSLDEIKNNLFSINTKKEAETLLKKQKQIIEDKISDLKELLDTIQTLIVEVNEMEEVDFDKYAKIITLIREKDENYKIIKYLDNKVIDNIEKKFDKNSGNQLIEKMQEMCEEIERLQIQGEKPEGEKGQKIAKEWWESVQLFTGGDNKILFKLTDLYQNNEKWREYLKDRNIVANKFIEEALEIYLRKKEGE